VTESWPANVAVFTESSWTAWPLEPVPLTVHGVAFTGSEVGRLPFDAIEAPADGRTHVALAHGSELGSAHPNLAYVALGHYHETRNVAGNAGTMVWYSGAPEGIGFDDPGEHGYLEIEMDEGEVRVRSVASSRVEYVSHTIECSDLRSSEDIAEAIRALSRERGRTQLARITLTGAGQPEWRYELHAVRGKTAPEFELLAVADATKPNDDYEALAHECTSLGGFIARINAELMDASDLELRRLLERAREVGLAAYRAAPVPVGGSERG
jgi:DNA repair exonuclease SbcCD nuclease subunit